jgi:hypothetical protein
LLDWESLARAQFRQGVAKEHNLGALAMNKRGGGRAAVVKAEVSAPVVLSNGSASATSSASALDGSSSEGLNNGGSSSAVGNESQKMDVSTACPGSSSSLEAVRDSSLAASIASNTAALDVGLLGVTPDIVNRYDIN